MSSPMTSGNTSKSKVTLPMEEPLQLKGLLSLPSTLFFALTK